MGNKTKEITSVALEDIILRGLDITLYNARPVCIPDLADLCLEKFVVIPRTEFTLADIELIRSTIRLLLFDKYKNNYSVRAEYISSLQMWGFRCQ